MISSLLVTAPATRSMYARPRSGPARQGLERPGEELGRPLRLADNDESLCEREQPGAPLRCVRWRQPERVLGERRGVLWGAARKRARDSCGDRRCELCIGLLGGERKVQRTQLLVGNDARELQMELAPFVGLRSASRRCGEQGVGGAHTVAVDEHHTRVHRGVERVWSGDRRSLGEAQVRAQRDDEQQPAHGAGQPFDAGAEQVLDAVRHGDLLADRGQAVSGERASDLEREQGIPERRLVDAAQELPREAQPEPLGQDPPRGAEAERADLEPSQRPPLERALESSLDTGALGEQEADGLALEPAHGEVECVGGRRIEPLDVVDRDQQRLTGGQGAQRVQEAERDRVGLGRRARRLGPQKGHLQRAQLRSRQADELLRLDAVEQVDQRGKREPRVGAARPRREHAASRASGRTRGRPPRASSCRFQARP